MFDIKGGSQYLGKMKLKVLPKVKTSITIINIQYVRYYSYATVWELERTTEFQSNDLKTIENKIAAKSNLGNILCNASLYLVFLSTNHIKEDISDANYSIEIKYKIRQNKLHN